MASQPPPSYDEVIHTGHDAPQQPATPYRPPPASPPPLYDHQPTKADTPTAYGNITTSSDMASQPQPPSYDEDIRMRSDAPQQPATPYRPPPASVPTLYDCHPTNADIQTEATDSSCDAPTTNLGGWQYTFNAGTGEIIARTRTYHVTGRSLSTGDWKTSFGALALLAGCVCLCNPCFGLLALILAVQSRDSGGDVNRSRRFARRSMSVSTTGIFLVLCAAILIISRRTSDNPKGHCPVYELYGICYDTRTDCVPTSCCRPTEVKHEGFCYSGNSTTVAEEYRIFHVCEPFIQHKCKLSFVLPVDGVCTSSASSASTPREVCVIDRQPGRDSLDMSRCCDGDNICMNGHCYKTAHIEQCCRHTALGKCYDVRRPVSSDCLKQTETCCQSYKGTLHASTYCYYNEPSDTTR